MVETLPFTLIHPAEEGKVRLVATPEARFCNLANTIHGGWITTMLDTAMSLAAQTTLSPGETCPSHETTTKFIRPISVASGVMHVFGHVASRGRTVITLEGRIEDAEGRLHADGTSTCLVMFLDQGSGRDPRIIVILSNYSHESRLRHLSDEIEVIERTRSNRGPAVHMGIDAVLEDRINPSFLSLDSTGRWLLDSVADFGELRSLGRIAIPRLSRSCPNSRRVGLE